MSASKRSITAGEKNQEPAEHPSSTSRKTRRTLRDEADPVAMHTRLCMFRCRLGITLDFTIKACLLSDEPARKKFEWEDGSLAMEPLIPMSFEKVASLVPAEKAQKTFRKWFGKKDREKEIGFEVIEQMRTIDQPLHLVYPPCLYRYSALSDEICEDLFGLEDAKEMCRHWSAVEEFGPRFALNISMEEMTKVAMRILEVYDKCRSSKGTFLENDLD